MRDFILAIISVTGNIIWKDIEKIELKLLVLSKKLRKIAEKIRFFLCWLKFLQQYY